MPHELADFKPRIFLSFENLPESKDWKNEEVYRVRLVLKQKSLSEDGANFEVVDAVSLEPNDKGKRKFLSSDGGLYKS